MRFLCYLLFHLLLPLRQIGSQAVLQDDSACPHRALLVDFLQQVGVTRMDWPAYSPDLNPIKNLWDLFTKTTHDH